MTVVEFHQKFYSFLRSGTDTLYFKKQELTKIRNFGLPFSVPQTLQIA